MFTFICEPVCLRASLCIGHKHTNKIPSLSHGIQYLPYSIFLLGHRDAEQLTKSYRKAQNKLHNLAEAFFPPPFQVFSLRQNGSRAKRLESKEREEKEESGKTDQRKRVRFRGKKAAEEQDKGDGGLNRRNKVGCGLDRRSKVVGGLD